MEMGKKREHLYNNRYAQKSVYIVHYIRYAQMNNAKQEEEGVSWEA